MGSSQKSAQFLIDSKIADATRGDVNAYFDLGIVYSTGAEGMGIDLVAAHKWFNLAAVAGLGEAQHARADVSEGMTVREIAEAQRQARAWMGMTNRRAA